MAGSFKVCLFFNGNLFCSATSAGPVQTRSTSEEDNSINPSNPPDFTNSNAYTYGAEFSPLGRKKNTSEEVVFFLFRTVIFFFSVSMPYVPSLVSLRNHVS